MNNNVTFYSIELYNAIHSKKINGHFQYNKVIHYLNKYFINLLE